VHYLVTGHTGFKGAWLALMLAERGHQVSGLALDPLPGSLFERAGVSDVLTYDIRQDVREPGGVQRALTQTAPDAVLHLAAQPLVRESYRDPRGTIETNVMGTLNVLEAVAATPSVRALLVVTTDKVYRNVDQEAGYTENDPLGGHDPYSASKAMADLLTQSWVDSFPGCLTAIARAGNVIGGGDVSPERLLPDLMTGFESGKTVEIRYPDAVRPWQHVLDCLNGYLALTDALLAGRGAGEWNFGPGREGFVTVAKLADLAAELWGAGAGWAPTPGDHPHEAGLLALDATKAEQELGWRNRLGFADSVAWTVEWYRQVSSGASPAGLTRDQLQRFAALS
jgi:CDP-glucose 4,6-dehydratase